MKHDIDSLLHGLYRRVCRVEQYAYHMLFPLQLLQVLTLAVYPSSPDIPSTSPACVTPWLLGCHHRLRPCSPDAAPMLLALA